MPQILVTEPAAQAVFLVAIFLLKLKQSLRVSSGRYRQAGTIPKSGYVIVFGLQGFKETGGTYISHFTVDEPAHKEFEAGYDESEPSLRVVFELTDGKWYVTDCYNDWYNFDLPISELEETIQAVQEENKAFEELHP